jgi:pyridoxamine 5'-phosphate oxidase
VDRKHPWKTCAFSTINGLFPKTRTVVLRKLENKQMLSFYTDFRSEKMQHLMMNPNASVLFYNPKNHCQLVVQVLCKWHNQDEISHVIFKNLPEKSHKDYAMNLAPGAKIQEPNSAKSLIGNEGIKHFTLIKSEIQSLEILQLSAAFHLRAKFIKKEENWEMNWLLP